MRRVAAEIGSAPMALYHHVRSKEQLLSLLLEDVARELPVPELPADPRERIVVAATIVHDLFLAHPWVVEALTSDDLLSATALWFPEAVVDAAIACGVSPDDVVRVYRTIWYYTAGEIVVGAAGARRRAADDRPTYREQVFADLDAQELAPARRGGPPMGGAHRPGHLRPWPARARRRAAPGAVGRRHTPSGDDTHRRR